MNYLARRSQQTRLRVIVATQDTMGRCCATGVKPVPAARSKRPSWNGLRRIDRPWVGTIDCPEAAHAVDKKNTGHSSEFPMSISGNSAIGRIPWGGHTSNMQASKEAFDICG